MSSADFVNGLLGQYADTLDANEIGVDLLPRLTDEALEKLGVAVMGHRIRLLDAIAIHTDPVSEPAEDMAPVVTQVEAAGRQAERRQITVMFCDLVGSTALSERLDPEVLREVMQSFQQAAGNVIERYGGHVAQYLGDGIMAYFGWPKAHEHEAERAVMASLEMVGRIAALDTPERLAVRIGIGESLRPSVVLGLLDLESDAGGESRANPLILVGRDAEIALLHRARQQSKEGLGQVVLVNGEPGIGKTALIENLATRAREEGSPRIIFRCSAFHTNSAMYPVIAHVKRLMEWRATDSAEIHQDKLEQMLGGYDLPKEEVVPLFAAFLSVSLPPERYPQPSLGPEELKQQILDSLVAWTLDEAERKPTLMICEDLHWADPSTLEYLGMLLDQAPTTSLLLVLTFRPDFELRWRARSHMTPITLARLERPQIEFMVKRLAQGKDLPGEVMEYIIRKTDGVPLFVEELTKTLIASEVLQETANRYELTGPLSSVAIPATLQESLMARLDRLPTAREVAQLGAVLGREFAYDMMQALGYIDDTILQDGLARLVAEELLYQRGRPPRAKYVFKHILIRDAAYHSLLKRTRQQYHRHVAGVLQEHFSQEVASEPELLAYHFTGADMAPQAIEHWLKAAKRAASRSKRGFPRVAKSDSSYELG